MLGIARSISLAVHLGEEFWVALGAIGTLLAVLVALFKDEISHLLYAPSIEVTEEYGDNFFDRVLKLRNSSRRQAAIGVTVRGLWLDHHPIEHAIGPQGVSLRVATDTLIPRPSGETTFDIPPRGEVRLPLMQLRDAEKPEEPVTAEVPWADVTSTLGHEGLLIAPSVDEVSRWKDEFPAAMEGSASIELEVAARNVPARVYALTVARRRDPSFGDSAPWRPGLRIGSFDIHLAPLP
jgi:hypothetical protein